MGRVRSEAQELFPEAGWSIRSRTNAAPGLSRNIERFSQFLTLVGLTALVVGGVGVANAVASFVDLKRPAIATLKCLGARSGLVFRIYLDADPDPRRRSASRIGLAIGAAMPFVGAGGAGRPGAGLRGRSLYPARARRSPSLYGAPGHAELRAGAARPRPPDAGGQPVRRPRRRLADRSRRSPTASRRRALSPASRRSRSRSPATATSRSPTSSPSSPPSSCSASSRSPSCAAARRAGTIRGTTLAARRPQHPPARAR